MGILSLNYPKNKFWNGFRQFKYLKVFFIAFVWASILVIPLYTEALIGKQQIFYAFFSLNFFFIGICLPFDVRDMKSDKGKIITIPNVFGVKKAKQIAILSITIALFIAAFGYFKGQFSATFIYAFCTTLFYSFLIIGLTNKKRKEPFYLFWVDFALVIPLIIYLICQV